MHQSGMSLMEIMVSLLLIGLLGSVVIFTLPENKTDAEIYLEKISKQIRYAQAQSNFTGHVLALSIENEEVQFSKRVINEKGEIDLIFIQSTDENLPRHWRRELWPVDTSACVPELKLSPFVSSTTIGYRDAKPKEQQRVFLGQMPEFVIQCTDNNYTLQVKGSELRILESEAL